MEPTAGEDDRYSATRKAVSSDFSKLPRITIWSMVRYIGVNVIPSFYLATTVT